MNVRMITVQQANRECTPDSNGFYFYWRTWNGEKRKFGYVMQLDEKGKYHIERWARTQKELWNWLWKRGE